jgi:hypothetical protein
MRESSIIEKLTNKKHQLLYQYLSIALQLNEDYHGATDFSSKLAIENVKVDIEALKTKLKSIAGVGQEINQKSKVYSQSFEILLRIAEDLSNCIHSLGYDLPINLDNESLLNFCNKMAEHLKLTPSMLHQMLKKYEPRFIDIGYYMINHYHPNFQLIDYMNTHYTDLPIDVINDDQKWAKHLQRVADDKAANKMEYEEKFISKFVYLLPLLQEIALGIGDNDFKDRPTLDLCKFANRFINHLNIKRELILPVLEATKLDIIHGMITLQDSNNLEKTMDNYLACLDPDKSNKNIINTLLDIKRAREISKTVKLVAII